MFFDFLGFLLLFCVTLLVGLPFVSASSALTGTRKVLTANLIGIAILCVSGSWTVALDLNIKYFWLFLALIVIVSVAQIVKSKSYLVVQSKFKNLDTVMTLVYVSLALFISSLHNPSLFKSYLSFRNGPDLVGWTSGVQFFSNDNKLSELKSRILTELGATDFESTLTLPGETNQTFLYKVPSFADQINGEFLLGAHRTGLPSFLGAVDNLLGRNFTFHLLVGMLSLIFVIVFGLTHDFLRISGLNRSQSIFLSACGVLNLGILSVLLEGGIGQILLLPYLVLFLRIFLTSTLNSAELFSVIFLATAVSLSTYSDFLYFFGPLSLIFFVTLWKVRVGFFRHSLAIFSAYFLGFLVSWPILTSLPRLFWDRFFGHPGGWNMGRFPTPFDIFGFINWLPSDSVSVFQNQGLILTLAGSLSIYLMYLLIIKLDFNYRLVTLTFLLSYVLVITLVYSKSETNNYPLFKASSYFAVLVPFIMLGFYQNCKSETSATKFKKQHAQNKIQNKNKKVNRGKQVPIQGLPLFVVLLSCSVLISSTNWTFGWLENRQQSIRTESSRVLQPIINKYDIIASGFNGAGTAKLALLGDLRYVSASRGFNSSVLRSSPSREWAFFLNRSICASSQKCLIRYENSQRELVLLTRVDEFDIYLER